MPDSPRSVRDSRFAGVSTSLVRYGCRSVCVGDDAVNIYVHMSDIGHVALKLKSIAIVHGASEVLKVW